jgi:crotonobetainyl-CoA:carnitine CoA-transferase CaiB-like acyl-CoA transferase
LASIPERISSYPAFLPHFFSAAKVKIAQRIKTKTRDEWTLLLEGTDMCFAPVLDLDEATDHPHMKARGIFVDIAGKVQPGPAPRFSRSETGTPKPGVVATHETVCDLLRGWLDEKEVNAAYKAGTI